MYFSIKVTDPTHSTFQSEPPTSEEASAPAGGVPCRLGPSSPSQKPEHCRYLITITRNPHRRGIRQTIREQLFRRFSTKDQRDGSQFHTLPTKHQQDGAQALSPHELPGESIPCEISSIRPVLELHGDIPASGIPVPPMSSMSSFAEMPRLQQYRCQDNRHCIDAFDHGRQWSPEALQRSAPQDWLSGPQCYSPTEECEGSRRLSTPYLMPSPPHDRSSGVGQQSDWYSTPTSQQEIYQAPALPENPFPYQYGEGNDPRFAVSPVSTSYGSTRNYPTPPTASPTSCTSMSPTTSLHGIQVPYPCRPPPMSGRPDFTALPTHTPYGTRLLDSHGPSRHPGQAPAIDRRKFEDRAGKPATMTSPLRHGSIGSISSEEPPPAYHASRANVGNVNAMPIYPIPEENHVGSCGDHEAIPFPVKGIIKLLSMFCHTCNKEFKGKYCKGNLARHNRHFHQLVVHSYKCRFCENTYKRCDAKKKHEWENHGAPDSRPRERRAQNTQKTQKRKFVKVGNQRRIYMPNEDYFELGA